MAGVVDAEVSYDEARAVVRYRPDEVTPAQMIAAVNDTGFTAELAEEGTR